MIVAVVGSGRVGRLHQKVLRSAGLDVFSVDPRGPADYRNVGEVTRRPVDVWVVACPTAAHLPVLGQILTNDPSARVLLEKPMCEPSQVSEMGRLLAMHPRASVLVSDVYSYSVAVTGLRDRVLGSPAGVREIAVDMSKNRIRDVECGRFVDPELGEAGYEWIHMYRVASLIGGFDLAALPSLLADHTNYRDRILEIEFSNWRLRLSSGLDGILSGARRPELYRGRNAEMVRSGFIPRSSEFRHRSIEVAFGDGSAAGVLFEPFHEQVSDHKNVHLGYLLDRFGHVEAEEVRQNHFSDSSIAQIRRLHAGPPGQRSALALTEVRILAQTATRLAAAEVREGVG